MILRWLTPSWYVPAIQDVDLDRLRALGVAGIIVDVDNTLVPADGVMPSQAVKTWVAQLHAMGFHICIVSNNFAPRSNAIGRILQIPVVRGVIKPTPWVFHQAMRLMGTRPSQTAFIGDQLFTDVLGGNLVGMRTILVDPLSPREFPTTRLVRMVERIVRRRVVNRVPGL